MVSAEIGKAVIWSIPVIWLGFQYTFGKGANPWSRVVSTAAKCGPDAPRACQIGPIGSYWFYFR
jgi:hypothetical protein